MNCVGIFADFVFKVVSQLTRVIQPQNKRSIFQRDDISYILYYIYMYSLFELKEFFFDPDNLHIISWENQACTLKIICDFF